MLVEYRFAKAVASSPAPGRTNSQTVLNRHARMRTNRICEDQELCKLSIFRAFGTLFGSNMLVRISCEWCQPSRVIVEEYVLFIAYLALRDPFGLF